MAKRKTKAKPKKKKKSSGNGKFQNFIKRQPRVKSATARIRKAEIALNKLKRVKEAAKKEAHKKYNKLHKC